MNSTTTCLPQNSHNPIDEISQSIFFVLSFCSIISNIYIHGEKILENNEINKNFKKINNTYTVLKEYFFNNYKEDNNGNIIFEKNIEVSDNKIPEPPDSKKIEKDIKELINYQSPPPSIKKSKSLKKEIDDFLNSDDEEEKKILNDNNDLKHYHKNTKNSEDKIKQRNEDKIKHDKKHKKKDELNKNIKIKK